MPVTPDSLKPGQESVWAYPRPAVAEATSRRIQIIHRGVTVADTRRAVRTLETSHPPTYYLPLEDVAPGLLRPGLGSSFCEWKGSAVYYDAVVGEQTLKAVAWGYPRPSPAFASLKDHAAFYAAPFDACLVDGERVTPQAGGFYGGWITSHVAGPFKGPPGTRFW